jgi:hypothetical protein
MRLSYKTNYRGYNYRGFVLEVIIGKGAGYIGGHTVFIAYNSGSLKWLRNNRNGIVSFQHNFIDYSRIGNIELGFTQNANVVPYPQYP